jgi:hypothetical protein
MPPIVERLLVIILLSVSIHGFSTDSPTAAVSVQALPRVAPVTHLVYVLHGVGPFSRAVASASVTRLSPTRFSLSLRTEHLPSPVLLHARFARHAYVG